MNETRDQSAAQHGQGDTGLPVPRLRLNGITKRFPGTLANDAVSLTLLPGEIHALLGENGAGKSTLVKIVYGVLQADEGEIEWNGTPVEIADPAAARRLGIGMVFQHFSLFETLTVAENIALALPASEVRADRARADRARADTDGVALPDRIRAVAARYGLTVDPARPVHALSTGERQRVEIIRCLLQNPQLLIMDEPTSVLTPQEADSLFETLRRLAADGCTILYISHKLEEIRALCHRATVLRGGKVVGVADPATTPPRAMAELMIGGTLATPHHLGQRASGEVRLAVRGLSLPPDQPFGVPLHDLSLTVRAGEILGIAGLAGSGQGELLAALAGERRVPADTILLDGQPVGHLGVAARRRRGLAYVPEERLGRGAVPDMSLAENAILSTWGDGETARRGMVVPRAAQALAGHIIDRFRVAATGPQALARRLSGGNLQKFIMGREILREPQVLIVAAPTWGVDAGAAAAIHQALLDLADRGAAVLVISQDLDELFAVADRIAALYHGRLSAAVPTATLTREAIGLMMGGADAA